MPRTRRLAFVLCFVAAMAAFWSAAMTSAADTPTPPESGAVTGTGSAKLERTPELLRIQFDLSADGKDVKDALTKLRDKEKSTREKLAKLGAVEKAVKVEESRMGVSSPEQQMMMARMRGGRPQARPATGPSTVQVTATVRAEWKLNARAADEMLVEAQDLTAKIKAADLLGKLDAKKATTPEEQEEAEERVLMAQANGQAVAEDVAPQFVSPISEEERTKLLADAFAKAKSDAVRLAKAAGADLGPIRQLSGMAIGGVDEQSGRYNDYQMRMMYGRGGQSPPADSDDSAEAIGMTPGKVTYRVSVTASFALK